jgi:hypothetical protein
MRGLHRLLHHGDELLAQLLQVHLMAQRGAKGCQGTCCIIFAAVEAAIYSCLDTLAQGVEEGKDSEGGDNDSNLGGLIKEPPARALPTR